ncbi:MAG TPA: hypothetical protein VNH11_33865 [Pirellulales bacterium]|nr:hypothetical protein [Pirellulales bacterium]
MLAAVRLRALYAQPDGFQLRLALRLMDILKRRTRPWQGPVAQNSSLVGGAVQPPPKTAVAPLFRAADRWGTQRIAIDIRLKGREVGVFEEQPHAAHAPVENVEQHAARG